MNNPYSQDPNDNPHGGNPEYASYDKPKSNPLGIVGFVLSLTCLLSPIGLLVSLIALLKRPRGFAIAGTIIGVVFSGILIAGTIGAITMMNLARGGMAIGVMQVQAEVIERQVGAYSAETGSLPSSLDDVHLPAVAKNDPWGTAYQLNPDTPTQGRWTISSAGPDGQFGTGDDIADMIMFSAKPPNDVVEGWLEQAQTDKDKWPGFGDTVRIAAKITTWSEENQNTSAVAGGNSLQADPSDTPEDPETP
ncbi:MAG: type II secretion system protein GspG [Phycisphaerales bacterium JB065]